MEIQRQGQNERELALRKYFKGLPQEPSTSGATALLLLGFAIAIMALISYLSSRSDGSSDGTGSIVFVVIGVVMATMGFFWRLSLSSTHNAAWEEIQPQPTDAEVDRWFHESIRGLYQHSKNILSLDETEANTSNPILIIAPTLQAIQGIPQGEMAWRKGIDGKIRFAIHKVAIIHLTSRHLGAFICDFNFIRNVSLNESTQEYHYCDVVSVSTQEKSQVDNQPTGEKRTLSQVFALSVSSGESIQVPVDIEQIRRMTGMQESPETGAPTAVRTIRAMLRDKKETVESKAA